jgi:hypothetical protein
VSFTLSSYADIADQLRSEFSPELKLDVECYASILSNHYEFRVSMFFEPNIRTYFSYHVVPGTFSCKDVYKMLKFEIETVIKDKGARNSIKEWLDE